LVKIWYSHAEVTSLRKSLDGVNYKQAFLTMTAGIAVITFMYKMGVAGKLANFTLGLISEIVSPSGRNILPFESMVEKLGSSMQIVKR
jgi:hypothetical protein